MDITELARLTDEIEILEGKIEEAEATVVKLRQRGYNSLAGETLAGVEELIRKKTELETSLSMLNRLSSGGVNRDNVPIPPRGKKLLSAVAYAYMNLHPDGKAIVAEEFWVQVKKDANEFGCWDVLFPVSRTPKGTLKKLVYIHWFRKKLGAVRLAWFLCGLPMDDEENLYNECGNDLCVNPAHHYMGAAGKIKKRRDRSVVPVEPSFGDLEEYANTVFSYLCNKLDGGRHGVTFKELEEQLVGPKNEIPDSESLRKALQTKRAKDLLMYSNGIWAPKDPELWKKLGYKSLEEYLEAAKIDSRI